MGTVCMYEHYSRIRFKRIRIQPKILIQIQILSKVGWLEKTVPGTLALCQMDSTEHLKPQKIENRYLPTVKLFCN